MDLTKTRIRIAAALAAAFALHASAQQPAPTAGGGSVDLQALQAEVERLRSIAPGQAVAMTQVAYNFNNLWFAMHEENWPLAQFYANETRVRLRWAMRITPSRKISSGELELAPILEALEANELGAVLQAVADHDVARFETAYRETLAACTACHVASEKPYLHLQVPTAPAEPMIRMSPE